MIIECEGCHSKFRLDEKRLKKIGSKVRCSKCNHAFIAFPPEIELQLEETSLKEEEATVVSPKDVEIAAPKETEDVLPEEAPEKEDQTSTFDKTLSLEFEEVVEPISIDDLPDFEEDLLDENGERQAEIQGAMDRAKRIEEEVIDREQPEKAREAEVVEAPAKRRPVAKKRRTSGLLITILVIILLFVGAVAAVQFFAPDFFPGSFPFFKKSPP